MKVKVVIEPSEEGGFTVYVPSLPGCVSDGETEEEALRNIKEAIELYLEPTEDDAVLNDRARVVELVMCEGPESFLPGDRQGAAARWVGGC